ncbi:transcriptional regulator, partial [Lactiplantibacillus plantarum]|uniref:helix-turn-helix domain-containing protein n=1 Tax=Lactiplantibacillus plantarum TaxID=1590 RepID=UPI000CC022D1
MNKFPEQLKKLRKETNTTQDDLATKLFVTRQAISKWESGDSTPDLTNLIKLTDIFNVSLDLSL